MRDGSVGVHHELGAAIEQKATGLKMARLEDKINQCLKLLGENCFVAIISLIRLNNIGCP